MFLPLIVENWRFEVENTVPERQIFWYNLSPCIIESKKEIREEN